MKKTLAISALALTLLFVNNMANAAVYSDVPADYWANKEITMVVTEGILPLQNGNYNPETTVSRSEFNSALLRTLGHQQKANVTSDVKFSDITTDRADYNDVLLSQNVGLIYGYLDGTFKPDRVMTKTEAASVISHITQDYKGNLDSLKAFTDASSVPAWGKYQFAKTVDLDIYVNYPDAEQLLPNKDLNRAEAAVLLYKLRNSLNKVKTEYVAQETLLSTEHLDVTKKATVDEVQITNMRKIVLAQNILKGYFYSDFNSKTANVGDVVTFTAKDDVYTKEGTLVIPAATTMKATVSTIENQAWLNRNAKVTLNFESLTLPSGITVPFNAVVLNHDGILTENYWAKPLGYTLAGTAIGTGAGLGVGIPTDELGKGLGIGIPCGAGAGLVAGLVTPGRIYKANESDYLWLELTAPLSIPNEE